MRPGTIVILNGTSSPGKSAIAGIRRAALIGVLAAGLVQAACGTLPEPRRDTFVLQPGDLLFQDLNGDAFSEAIARVTTGYRGAVLTHVGIAAEDDAGRIVVLEAFTEGVVATPLEEFLGRSLDREGRPKVLVGRLKPRYRHLVPGAVAAAFARRGKPYDDVFEIGNGAYYCSELVYACFREAGGGADLFELEPMTFLDPETGETFPAWEEYFAGLGVPIPEGRPGLNPGGISRSPALEIVHAYGEPAGWDPGGK